MHEPLVLVRFRPTARQAIGHGLFIGLVGALIMTVAVTGLLEILTLIRRPDTGGSYAAMAIAALVTLGVPPVGGALAGLLWGRRIGTEADELGVRPTSTDSARPWREVIDLRTERRGGRIHVVAYLYDGAVLCLPAPYDGRFLAHDPGFDHKYFLLRECWEGRRRWSLPA
jgi:hypothetical protein